MPVGLGLPEEFGLQKDRIRLRWEIPLEWRSACSAKLAERLRNKARHWIFGVIEF
jgi:hypothetical protein